MNEFLDELFLHCMQKEPPPCDSRYHADRDALTKMEEQIEAAVTRFNLFQNISHCAIVCGWELA